MKKLIFISAIMLAFVSISSALEWSVCLEYLFPNADPAKAWVLQDDSDGKGIYIAKWNLPDTKPTQDQLQSVETAAIAWYKNREAEKLADIENLSDESLEAVVKVLMAEINVLRKQTGLTEKTPEDFKADIKAQITSK